MIAFLGNSTACRSIVVVFLSLTAIQNQHIYTQSLLKISQETNSMTKARSKTEINPENFYVEDYPQFDPTPNSRASIKNGPIEHGTPLMPYIPRPTPPAATPRHASGSAPGPLNQPVFPPPPRM